MSKPAQPGRFKALKLQMEENLKSDETAEEITNMQAIDQNNHEDSSWSNLGNDKKHSLQPQLKTAEKLEIVLQNAAAPKNPQPQTRKTFSLPMILDLAIKDLKYKRNLDKKIKGANTAKNTEDDIVAEALFLYFSQAGEYKAAFDSAQLKFKVLVN